MNALGLLLYMLSLYSLREFYYNFTTYSMKKTPNNVYLSYLIHILNAFFEYVINVYFFVKLQLRNKEINSDTYVWVNKP